MTSLLSMAEHLDAVRFETIFVVPGEGPILQRAKESPVRTVVLQNPEVSLATQAGVFGKANLTFKRLRYVRSVAAFLKREHVDMVFLSSVHSVFAGMGAALARRPIAWHVHETIENPGRATRMKLALVERLASALFYDSESGRQAFPAKHVVRQQVQLNWIDLDRIRQPDSSAEETALASIGLCPGQSFILANGVIPRKGPDILVGAAKKVMDALHARNETTALPVFVFSGACGPELQPFYEALQSDIAASGGQELVRFAGVRDDLPALLRRATIYVSPSRNEALPITMIEAMAAGTPVIATDVGDCRSFLEDGNLGTVVPPENADALAAAILEHLQNPVAARQKAQLAQQKVLKLYQPGGFYEDLETTLMELARERGMGRLPAG
ncbi:MAG: glycosyltransferase family 4 protein [Candidatus Sumerlaeaceae bacterium]